MYTNLDLYKNDGLNIVRGPDFVFNVFVPVRFQYGSYGNKVKCQLKLFSIHFGDRQLLDKTCRTLTCPKCINR